MRRNILVTGATGKQGSGLIRALRSQQDAEPEYHIYAFTRKASSPAAQSLASVNNITVVEGDLNIASTISKIFDDAKPEGGIWGVFAVLAYNGLGQASDVEERQGKMLADLSLEYHVSAFIYSSSMRAGPKHEDKPGPSVAKVQIERHCRALGEKGLPWTFLHPGFFMENFDSFVGSIAVGILKAGLNPDTTLGLIASEDIGHVAVAVFNDFDHYKHNEQILVAEFLTMFQVEGSHKRTTGRPIPCIPSVLATLLLKLNRGAQDLVKHIDFVHATHAVGDYPEREMGIESANAAYKMTSYHDWAAQRNNKNENTGSSGWNKVSLWKLVTGGS